jgi:hypothetical protein
MHRFERGKELVMKGLGDVLRGSDHDNLAAIYFLKETGGAGKLASIARNSENSDDTRGLAKEALRLISEDERFVPKQREFAAVVISEIASGMRIASINALGGPMAEGRA